MGMHDIDRLYREVTNNPDGSRVQSAKEWVKLSLWYDEMHEAHGLFYNLSTSQIRELVAWTIE